MADALDRALGLAVAQGGLAAQSSPAIESRLDTLTAEIEALRRQIEILSRQFLPLQQTIIELRRALIERVPPK